MEDKLLKKLNFKGQQQSCVLNAPVSFQSSIDLLAQQTALDLTVSANKSYQFVLLFALDANALTTHFNAVKENLEGDVVLWVAYAKKSSKKYTSEINRDSGHWQILGDEGYEGVRQVAIDEDWSALRFRHVDYIKTMKRNPKLAMSEKGKKRTKN
jgi:hypothetical protein